MKRKIFFLLLTILPLSIFGEVKITGKIFGSFDKVIVLYYPINGFSNSNVLQSNSITKIDSNKRFSFSLNINEPTFITVKIGSEPIWLIVEKNDKIDLIIHLDSLKKNNHNGWLIVKGPNSSGQMYFNEFNFQPYNKFIPINAIFDNIESSSYDLLQSVTDSIKLELEPFHDLLNKNLINKNYYEVVTKSIRASLVSEVMKHFIRKSKLYNVYSYHQIDSLKKSIFLLCNPLDTILYKGLLTHFYMNDYYLAKTLSVQKKLLTDRLNDTIISLKYKKIYISSSYVPFLIIKDKKLQESLWGEQLYNITNLLKERVKSPDIESFEYFFPKSIWIKIINNLLKNNNTKPYHINYDNVEIKYINLFDNWDSLIYQFKGKPIFIDIWATWCVPCREEFQFNDKLDSFLKKENILKLYISIDKPFLLKTWKDIIQTYPLKGYHILASEALNKDLKEKIYGSKENSAIPRYVIVNKEGEIIERNANRPSSGIELFDQLRRVLKLN